MKIVYIDDEKGNLLIFHAFIDRINKSLVGYKVDLQTFCGVDEDFKAYVKEADIVFTDWMMPVFDGRYVVEFVRSFDKSKPIIIHSALDDSKDIRKICLEHNCMTITKPLYKQTLEVIIKQHLMERDIIAEWRSSPFSCV